MSSPPHHPFPHDMASNPDPFEWGLFQPVPVASSAHSAEEVSDVEMTEDDPGGQSYPLSGASVYILASGDTDRDGDDAGATAAASEMAAFVAALGGQSVPLPEDATHALYVPVPVAAIPTDSESSSAAGGANPRILQSKIVECQSCDVPIVDRSWLERISGLRAGEHWSQIELDPFVPPIVALIDQSDQGQPSSGGVGGGIFQRMSSFGSSVRRRKRDRQPPRTSSSNGGGGSKRDAHSRLSQSLSQTAAYLSRENPEQMEQDEIRRAMELSMLDVALVLRRGDTRTAGGTASTKAAATKSQQQPADPHDILGVSRGASVEQIKAAYRKLALATHPDKGGSADEFFRVARAYRALLNPGHDATQVASPEAGPVSLKSTSHWDAELQDHRRLVEDLFANHGANLEENAQKLQAALTELGLAPHEAGSINRNERNELISNSCFYLSLANSYLRGIGALTCPDGRMEGVDNDVAQKLQEADDAMIGETALQLKRLIEAAVVKAHPEWAARGWVGEEIQAFSDFLTFTLDSSTLLADWAVCVFDTTSGFVDVYKGSGYKVIADKDRNWASTNTITLRYVPGHYQPLIQLAGGGRPHLGDVLACLDQTGVCYVVTDG